MCDNFYSDNTNAQKSMTQYSLKHTCKINAFINYEEHNIYYKTLVTEYYLSS